MKIITDKYHTITRKKSYLIKLDTKTITFAYLLSYYLGSSCKKYPDELEFLDFLDSFYGIQYEINVSIIGNKLLFTYSITYPDPKYILDESYTNEVLDDLFNELLKPYFKDNNFDDKKLNKAIKQYKIDLNEIISEPSEKANQKLINYYFKNTGRDYMYYGSIKELNNLKKEELLNFYHKLISSESIEYIVGNVNGYKDSIDTIKPQIDYKFLVRNDLKKNFKIDKAKTNNCHLLILIDPKIYAGDRLYDAFNLYTYYLGQSGYSLLFKNVREKNNLCYSISSSYYSATGIAIITAQIDKNNYLKVIDCIKETIDNSLNNFDLELQKEKYYKQNKPTNDYIQSLISDDFYKKYFYDLSNHDFKDRIYNITLDEIKDVKDYYSNFNFIYLYGGDID